MMKMSNIKKHSTLILSILVFVSIFIALYTMLPFTLMSWESNDLYLNTPDYMKDVNAGAHPFWQLLLNYCCQFFYYKLSGPAILAFLATMLYAAISIFIHHKTIKLLLAAILIISTIVTVFQGNIRETEQWNHLEYAAEHHLWNDVLSIATPDKCQNDRQMLPYALLGMAVKNELADKMFQYPVTSIEDFDMQGETNHRYFFYKMVLYDCLGCPNEAIHNNFQAATSLPYGTSFGTLRRLVTYNRNAGNAIMADKYTNILSHSTLHSNWKSQYTPYADTLTVNTSSNEALITRNLGINVASILNMGFYTPEVNNYFLCQLLAGGKLSVFASVLESVTKDKSVPLPVHFQEALLVYAHQKTDFDLTPYLYSHPQYN